MKILESSIKNQIKHIHLLKEGPAYIFENFVVTEFKEGATIDYECFKEIYALLDTYSGGDKQFGFLSNRVNNYAVKATDFIVLAQERKDATRYKSGVINYDIEGHQMFSFEKQFYKCDTKQFFGLNQAIHWAAPHLMATC
jgi:hypothetical protein